MFSWNQFLKFIRETFLGVPRKVQAKDIYNVYYTSYSLLNMQYGGGNVRGVRLISFERGLTHPRFISSGTFFDMFFSLKKKLFPVLPQVQWKISQNWEIEKLGGGQASLWVSRPYRDYRETIVSSILHIVVLIPLFQRVFITSLNHFDYLTLNDNKLLLITNKLSIILHFTHIHIIHWWGNSDQLAKNPNICQSCHTSR